jgi:hypothetical protein
MNFKEVDLWGDEVDGTGSEYCAMEVSCIRIVELFEFCLQRFRIV